MHLNCFHGDDKIKDKTDDIVSADSPTKKTKKTKSNSLTSYSFMNNEGKIVYSESKNFHIESLKQNRQIEKELKRHSKTYNSTIRLLLLGPGESGKSTVLKQMRLIHSSFYTEEEKRDNFIAIKVFIRDSMVLILNVMERFGLNFDRNNEHLNSAKAWLIKHAKYSFSGDSEDEPGFNMEIFWDFIEELWKSEVIKQVAKRGGEYHLHESALYFFDRVSILRSPNYKVNDQDMLRTRVQTNGIIETKFCTHGINFHIFDVGGQRDQRKKWIQCFDDVTAIIFVADISSFHKTIVEDNSTNRLVEALTVFNQIWNNRYLYHVSIILFLNKYDIFSHMILNEHCKLEDHFPAFKEYKCPENINNTFIVPNEHSEVTRAKMFILEEFIHITRNIDKSKMLSATRSVEMKNSLEYSQNNESLETYNKFCMPYFTCAVDTENIRRVFKSCRSILRKENMIKSGLI